MFYQHIPDVVPAMHDYITPNSSHPSKALTIENECDHDVSWTLETIFKPNVFQGKLKWWNIYKQIILACGKITTKRKCLWQIMKKKVVCGPLFPYNQADTFQLAGESENKQNI